MRGFKDALASAERPEAHTVEHHEELVRDTQ